MTSDYISHFFSYIIQIVASSKEHFSSNYEGTVRYGPKVIVRSIKRIKSGEEITVSYIDLLQPTVCFPELNSSSSF